MKVSFASLVAGVVLLAPAAALAHHSFAAEYDVKKPVTLKGTVTKWNLELASPNVLVRQGWNRHSLTVGDVVTVQGAQAKDGSQMANARTVTLADGRKVFAFSPGGGDSQ